MVRIAKKIDPKKIKELKQKIHTQTYLSTAINRLAQRLANELFFQEGQKNVER